MKRFEKWQLNKLKNKQGKTSYAGYLIIFAVIIFLTRITNELSTNISTYIQSSVVTEFFVKDGVSYEAALTKYSLINLAVSVFTMCSIFYKSLADILGRKAVMVINSFGIAIGMLLCYLSPVVAVYCMGVAVYTFFTQNDLQMIYIMEVAPKGKGTSLFGAIKSFGILGMLLVPILRDTVMDNNPELWRNVYIVPMAICVLIFLLSIVFLRESNTFIEKRINFLSLTDEERKIKAKEKNDVGVFKAIGYIFKHKEVLIPVIAFMFFGMCTMAAYSYVESLMTSNGLSAKDVTKALYIYPVVYAALSFIGGLVADKIGRKPVLIVSGFMTAFGFIAFILGCKNGINPYLIGLLNGIYLGGYFVGVDYMSIMLLEKVPTRIRGSIMGGAMMLMMGGCFLGVAQLMILMNIFGLNIAALSVIVPYSLISTFITIFAVKETKGTDLNAMD